MQIWAGSESRGFNIWLVMWHVMHYLLKEPDYKIFYFIEKKWQKKWITARFSSLQSVITFSYNKNVFWNYEFINWLSYFSFDNFIFRGINRKFWSNSRFEIIDYCVGFFYCFAVMGCLWVLSSRSLTCSGDFRWSNRLYFSWKILRLYISSTNHMLISNLIYARFSVSCYTGNLTQKINK